VVAKPEPGTYPDYFDQYIKLIGNQDPQLILKTQVLNFKALLSEIPFELEDHRYAEGKWSIKELVGHIIDTERILSYRALCIARGEQQPLPGFDENNYAVAGHFDVRSLVNMAHEFGTVREATISLYRNLSTEDLNRQGTANGKPVTPLAYLWIIPGHLQHHVNVLHERYIGDLELDL
jgi:hypothetical protein